jgi:hypothetical protein
VSVGSLGVPMSPMLVNEHVCALIAHGLISTERTHSHENYSPVFCVLAQYHEYSAHIATHRVACISVLQYVNLNHPLPHLFLCIGKPYGRRLHQYSLISPDIGGY